MSNVCWLGPQRHAFDVVARITFDLCYFPLRSFEFVCGYLDDEQLIIQHTYDPAARRERRVIASALEQLMHGRGQNPGTAVFD